MKRSELVGRWSRHAHQLERDGALRISAKTSTQRYDKLVSTFGDDWVLAGLDRWERGILPPTKAHPLFLAHRNLSPAFHYELNELGVCLELLPGAQREHFLKKLRTDRATYQAEQLQLAMWWRFRQLDSTTRLEEKVRLSAEATVKEYPADLLLAGGKTVIECSHWGATDFEAEKEGIEAAFDEKLFIIAKPIRRQLEITLDLTGHEGMAVSIATELRKRLPGVLRDGDAPKTIGVQGIPTTVVIGKPLQPPKANTVSDAEYTRSIAGTECAILIEYTWGPESASRMDVNGLRPECDCRVTIRHRPRPDEMPSIEDKLSLKRKQLRNVNPDLNRVLLLGFSRSPPKLFDALLSDDQLMSQKSAEDYLLLAGRERLKSGRIVYRFKGRGWNRDSLAMGLDRRLNDLEKRMSDSLR